MDAFTSEVDDAVQRLRPFLLTAVQRAVGQFDRICRLDLQPPAVYDAALNTLVKTLVRFTYPLPGR